MPTVKTTENEFRSQVVSWLYEFIRVGTYPFEDVSSDPSIRTEEGETRFPDIQVWLNRLAQQSFCGLELKTPVTAVNDSELLEGAAEKARARSADYFVTWNMRDCVIWRTPPSGTIVTAQERVKSYHSIYQVNTPDALWVEPNQIALKTRAKELLDDLSTLYNEGHLYPVEPDATFFVGRLNEAVKTLSPYMQQALLDKVGGDSKFKDGLFNWAVKQGIARYDDPSFYETVSHQIAYRLIARILFYQTLRRYRSDLPQMDISGLSPAVANQKLREFFEEARQIDWQAVFEEDFPDSVSLSDLAIEELAKLIQDLNRYNFSNMPQDIIGAVFEELIPPQERHRLGQYFTPENLVDFINAFCIKTRDAYVLDPTCGTGTFLTRGYDRMKILGQREHRRLLSQLWGVDIAPFPAELATINLFRQDLSDYANFPRILSKDFFEIRVGQSFQFPPPKASLDTSFNLIEQKLPIFDAAVGNFPYIRQELINRRVPDYKNSLERTMAEDWLLDYPEVFTISKAELAEYKRTKKIDLSKVEFKLSGQADIYAYLFFHTGRFIRDGGRMGFVTSNAWLDVAYGYELQKFLLNNFKIIAILESRCEPWFEESAVNTIVTIVERCSNKEERNDHLTKFVKVKKKLSELIPWDMKLDAQRRWFGVDALVRKIEGVGKEHYKLEGQKIVNTIKGLKTYEDEDFRIRFIKQGELLNKLIAEGKTSKWGQYLRAPQVYFDILEKCEDKLVPLEKVADIRYGIKTGVNEFFYLTDDNIKHWGIEEEFLVPIVTSPKEVESLSIEPNQIKYKAFLCHKDKQELQKEGKLNARKYIEWGEGQLTTTGMPWHRVPSVKGRKLWWDLGEREPGDFMVNQFVNERFFIPNNPHRILVGNIAWEGVFKNRKHKKIGSILGNCTFTALSAELVGRLNLGEGLLTTYGPEIEEFLLPDPAHFVGQPNEDELVKAFDKLSKRPIKPIFEEVKMKDRRRLDRLVLKALGLDPKQYLKPIYDGLTELVRERIELANMRKKVKQLKSQRDIVKLEKQVREEVLPQGAKKFPEEFLALSLKAKDFQDVSVPGEPLKLGMYFLGTQEVITDSGFTYQAKTVEEAKYLAYAQKPDSFIVRIPKDMVSVTKAVNDYERYLRELKGKLFQAFLNATFNHKLADTLAQRVFTELGLPDVVF